MDDAYFISMANIVTAYIHSDCNKAQNRDHTEQSCWPLHSVDGLRVIKTIEPDIDNLIRFNPDIEALRSALESVLLIFTDYGKDWVVDKRDPYITNPGDAIERAMTLCRSLYIR